MTIFLIRHAQSQFNEVFVRDQPNPMIYDAPLSELGHRQGVATQIRVSQLDIRHVIVSPLRRTLQTTALLFGATRPVEVSADVRKQLNNSCDVGRAPSHLSVDYPHLDFDHLEDIWWHEGDLDSRGFAVEPDHVLQKRANGFHADWRCNYFEGLSMKNHSWLMCVNHNTLN